MRLYYNFVTGSTALAGLAAGTYALSISWTAQTYIAAALAYWVWGVNQIFNDAGNLSEDALNAPDRPITSGKLALRPAIALSCLFLLALGAAAWAINPWTFVPLLLGAGLNLLYCKAKRVPLVGIFVYGFSIASCFLYGLLASDSSLTIVDVPRVGWILFVFFGFIHALMCHLSYFKDVPGDASAGVKTLQVCWGKAAAAWFSLLWLIPLGAYFLFLGAGLNPAVTIEMFWSLILIFLTVLLIIQNRYHAATEANCQANAALSLAVCAACSPLYLLAVAGTALGIHLIFYWYKNDKE